AVGTVDTRKPIVPAAVEAQRRRLCHQLLRHIPEEAYDALAKAGKQTVRVLAGVDNSGRRITASITVEVRRWSAKGTGTIQRQTPRAARGREARGGRVDEIAEEVASKLINKVESKADEVLQQAATTNKQPTPETKILLKNINKQLERFNESKPVTLDELRDLHKEQERSAGQAPDQPLRFTKKPASQTTAEDEEYRGIPYRGPKADPKKKQAPPKRPAANAGDRTAEAEPPAKRRPQGDAQAPAQGEAQLGSPRTNPPVTRKRTKEAAGLQDRVA
ncbi:hypothetical protein CYMTET_20402, partial [Cymbomonas tetramitiformis]